MTHLAIRIARRFATEFGEDDVAGLSAELAYRFLFAVFPFGIFVAALTAFVAQAAGMRDPTGQIIAALGDNLPPQVADQVRPQLEAVIGETRPGLLSLGAVGALWAATGGTLSLIKAMNRAYEVDEERPLVRRYVVAIGLTVLASAGILVAFVTIVGASVLTEEAARQLGLGGPAFGLLTLLRWPAVFVLLGTATGVLYRLAPNIRTPWRACFAGGALFALGWLIATAGFAFYVSNFGNYGNTYGALGGVIVLMLWFYLTAIILVGAAELVAVALKELRPDEVDRARHQAAARTARQTGKPPRRAGAAPSKPPVVPAAATGGVPRGTAARTPPSAVRVPASDDDRLVAGALAVGGLALGAVAAWALGRVTDR